MPQKPPVEHLELGLFGHARALITIKEAATALIVSEQKVRDWADEDVGYLKGVNIGDGQDRIHLRINRSSAEALYVHRMKLRGETPPYKLSAEAQWFLGELEKRVGCHLDF